MTQPNARIWKEWEREIANHAAAFGFDWRRRLRTGDSDDMLDIDGPLEVGFLIGGKTGGRMADRMSEAARQSERAKANLARINPDLAVDVVTWQVMKRRQYPTGKAYVLGTYDDLLRLAVERREWRQRP